METPVHYARLYAMRGTLARVDGVLTFCENVTGKTYVIEPDDVNWLTTQGQVADADAAIARMRGCHDYLNCVMGS